MLAAILAPPVAVVAASTVPAALVLLRSVEPGAALGGGAFFGTAFGGLIVGPFAWAGYALVAVLVATRSMTRRRAAAAIAAIWGTTALLVVGVVTLAVVASASRTAFGWEEARALLIATAWGLATVAWCAGVGWMSGFALPDPRPRPSPDRPREASLDSAS